MEKIKAEAMNTPFRGHINTKFPSITTPQKYVSIFRIDGVPILPPLMTQEKRRQMQKLKEKAVKVEQRLEESRWRRQKCTNSEYNQEVKVVNFNDETIENDHESSSSSCVSEHIMEHDDQNEDVEKSYMLLSDLLIQTQNETKPTEPDHAIDKLNRATAGESRDFDLAIAEPQSSETNLMQRMQKLQKSETLIYDHRSNTLLSTLSEDEIKIYQQQQQQMNFDHPDEKIIGRKIELREVEETVNLNYVTHAKSKTTFADKPLKKIPSICIDPPTPLTSSRTFSDEISTQSSIDTINENANKEIKRSMIEDLSSDESFSCVDSTNLERDLKTYRKVTNITGKIIKFENFSVLEPKAGTSKCSNIRPPQRSATSPSLKSATFERIQPPTVSLDITHRSQAENGLVRSNSFTLDCPSKALIEHIRQQKVSRNDNYPTKRTNLFSLTRDTVESKAKRVQKVDLKTRSTPTRLQLKPSTSNLTSPSSSQLSSSKMKRSPYEQKISKPKIARQLKKSVSGTTAIKQMKPRPSMPSIQSAKSPIDRTPSNVQFNGIEAEKRKKFLELLAHQKREQQRMQQVFEEQQQYLLEQLTAKVGSTLISNKIAGDNGYSTVENSLRIRTDYVEPLTLPSPTTPANSSVVSNTLDFMSAASELPSLDLSTIPTTSQSSNRITPRRRLFSQDSSPSPSLCNNNAEGGNDVRRPNGVTSGPSISRPKPAHATDPFDATMRREAAVTKINAHVRGYLVRRLFQTEQIQRIVQTIKDTLIFVLSLHMETLRDPVEAKAPANIKLKTRLLNQLTSALRTLHLFLFQTSAKERMEIISRDRKRIKTKILTMSMRRTPTFRT